MKKSSTSSSEKQIQNAKKLLESRGYFVRNLWHTDDVTSNHPDCPEEDAHDILYSALTNDATYEQIWLAIKYEANKRGY